MKIAKIIKIAIVLITGLCLSSCNESPHVDFHSYQELSEYDFIINGWIPEIMNDDAHLIQETYDMNSNHLYGKFDFKDRTKYDSIIKSYITVGSDSLLEKIESIKRPRCPEWFISKKDITKDKYIISKHNDFYLIMEKEANRIYFLR